MKIIEGASSCGYRTFGRHVSTTDRLHRKEVAYTECAGSESVETTTWGPISLTIVHEKAPVSLYYVYTL